MKNGGEGREVAASLLAVWCERGKGWRLKFMLFFYDNWIIEDHEEGSWGAWEMSGRFAKLEGKLKFGLVREISYYY